MQVTEKSHAGLAYEFAIIVPAATVEAHLEQELANVGKKVKIPGFRPGKVPLSVLKQKYAKDVMGDVLQRAVNDATREVLDGKKLRPALTPDVKISSFEEGKDLAFDVAFEVMPEVPEIAYEKIETPEYLFEVPQADIDETLTRIAKSRQHTHAKEGKAVMGDVVKMDFVGKKDGVAFTGGSAKGFSLELGSGQFIPGFEEQLVGVAAGDTRTVEVTFPKEYHSADLAGAPATFDVTVHEVAYIHIPEADDKLAQSMGFDTLDALKEAIKGQISGDYARAARAKAKKALFDTLEAQVSFEIPSKMLKLEFDSVWKQVEEAKKAGDASLKEKSDEALKKEYEAIAARRVRLGILLSELGRKNNVQITREELSAAVMAQARMYPGQEDKVFEFYRKNPQQVDELRGPILEEKTVDLILEKVKRKPVNVTIEELMRDEDDAENADAAPKKKPSKKKAD
jgi:trigger factor